MLKHRVQGAALPAMLPSSPSADYISDATLRLCFGRAVFCCPFPGERGSTTAHLRRLPRKGRAGGAQNLCSSIACRAQPCQRCSPVLQALIYLSVHFYGSASAEPFFVAHFSGERGSTTAHLRRLLIFAQASRAKTKSIGLRLFCKLFMNPIDKVGEQEYIFSSRAYRVLKVKQTAP